MKTSTNIRDEEAEELWEEMQDDGLAMAMLNDDGKGFMDYLIIISLGLFIALPIIGLAVCVFNILRFYS